MPRNRLRHSRKSTLDHGSSERPPLAVSPVQHWSRRTVSRSARLRSSTDGESSHRASSRLHCGYGTTEPFAGWRARHRHLYRFDLDGRSQEPLCGAVERRAVSVPARLAGRVMRPVLRGATGVTPQRSHREVLRVRQSVPHFNGFPAVSGATTVATKVMTASAIR
jgi:hypothetical protein